MVPTRDHFLSIKKGHSFLREVVIQICYKPPPLSRYKEKELVIQRVRKKDDAGVFWPYAELRWQSAKDRSTIEIVQSYKFEEDEDVDNKCWEIALEKQKEFENTPGIHLPWVYEG